MICSLILKLFSKFAHIFGGVVISAAHIIGLALFAPIFGYRYLVCKIGQNLNPSLGKMLTARGHLIGGVETFGKTSRSAIVIAAEIATDKSTEEIKSFVLEHLLNAQVSPESELLKYPEMQQYLINWLGFRFWKQEENFCIDEHIKIILSGNGQSFSKLDREKLVEELLNEPFPDRKSPWSTTIIDNNNSTKGCSEKLFVVKVHHCLADGYGILFTLLENLSNDPIILPVAKYAGDYRGIFSTLGFLVAFPFRALLECIECGGMFFQSHPWKIPDSRKSWKQIYMQSEIIPINKIKEIKTRFGVSFASVVHSAYASATRQSLLKKYASQGDLNYTPCAVVLPLPNHPKKLRNHCTVTHIKLPTMACDSLHRLRLCEEDLQTVKRSTLPVLSNFLFLIIGGLPASLVALVGKNLFVPVGISNFPMGVNSEFEMMGGKLVKLSAGLGACPGVAGVGFLVYSYVDGIQFTVTAESALMTHEDLHHLLECVEKEVEILFNLAVI